MAKIKYPYKSFKHLLYSLIDGSDPTTSSSRFLALITVVTVLWVWLFVSIWQRQLVDIPMGVIGFVSIVIIGRTVQGVFQDKVKE